MSARVRIAATACAVALASCGGGTSQPQGFIDGAAHTLVITAGNAKAIAAHALLQTTNPVNMLGGAGPLVAATNFLQPASPGPTQGGVVNANALVAPLPCSTGGAVVISGAIANTAGLGTGDLVQSIYQNCGVLANASLPIYLDGSAVQRVASGGAQAIPFDITLTGTLNNLRIGFPASDGVAARTNTLMGNETLQWTAKSAYAQTWSLSGTTLTNKTTSGTLVRMDNWGAYQQTVTMDADVTRYSLIAMVTTDNTTLGASGGNYFLYTSTPVVRNNVTHALTAGALTVEGSANATLYLSVGASGLVSIFVDANGDGSYETIISSTTQELSALQ